MPQMPVCQAYVEGQRALQGSWELGRHIRSGTIRRDRELNIEKSDTWLVLRGKTSENSFGALEKLCMVRSEESDHFV